jgi:hypothetical protein
MTPTMFFSHDRANAQFILGTHGGKTVIAKMSLPGIHGTQEESFEVIFEGDHEGAIDLIRDIINPHKPRIVMPEAA